MQQTIRNGHGNGHTGGRARGGCPPLLEIDLTHTDTLGPQVEWPPAPPTRQDPPHTAAPTGTPQQEVARLTTARAMRLLDASVAHLRTAMETCEGDDAHARLEQAIADIAGARDTLEPLGEA